jgi:glucuronate isomerase
MRPFIHDDFMLETDVAAELYHDHAEHLPIIDYHCHLPVKQIAEDHRFRAITEIWLNGDHYKWRAMRANGVPERLCTGDGSEWEKFEAWARTVPFTLRNPLYHWTHMELKRPFGIEQLLDARTARDIFDRCNARLAEPEFSAQGLLRQFRVTVVCTTDDPIESLAHHAALAARVNPETRVYPTFRPDRVLATGDPQAWNAWVDRL